jgi:cytochrome P450
MWEWITRPIPFLERCQRRYGDVFTVRFVVGEAVFVSDPELIKTVFLGDPNVLHAGEANALPLEPLLGRHSVLTLDGAEHMRQRKLMLPSFHGERMQRYGALMQEITEREVAQWPLAEPFALRPRTQRITLEVIMRAVFGIEEADQLRDVGERLTRLLEIGEDRRSMASIAIPGVRQTIGRRVWESLSERRERADAAIFDVIARRRSDPAAAERDDVLSILLQARDENGSAMTDQELRDELMTLLVAGHETTATAVAWTFDLLLHNPGALARLRREIEDGEGDAYLDAVVKESLRLRPVVPGVARKLTAPFDLNGWRLPAGARVAPNIYLTHRRPDVYPEPERFRPERFLDQAPDTYAWIPFGGGVRRCLGASFATFEMKTVIPTILRHVELASAGEGPERIRRRAITFAPEHGTRVSVCGRLRPAAVAPVAA